MRCRTLVLLSAFLAAACADRAPLDLIELPESAQLSASECELGVSDAEAHLKIAECVAEIDLLAAVGALNAG